MKPEEKLKLLEAIDDAFFEPDLSLLTDEELEFIVHLQEKYRGREYSDDMFTPSERKEAERIIKKLKDETRRQTSDT